MIFLFIFLKYEEKKLMVENLILTVFSGFLNFFSDFFNFKK